MKTCISSKTVKMKVEMTNVGKESELGEVTKEE